MAGAALSALEREEIRVGCDRGETFTAIALALGRAPSTISQEVGRRPAELGGDHHLVTPSAHPDEPCSTSRTAAGLVVLVVDFEAESSNGIYLAG